MGIPAFCLGIAEEVCSGIFEVFLCTTDVCLNNSEVCGISEVCLGISEVCLGVFEVWLGFSSFSGISNGAIGSTLFGIPDLLGCLKEKTIFQSMGMGI